MQKQVANMKFADLKMVPVMSVRQDLVQSLEIELLVLLTQKKEQKNNYVNLNRHRAANVSKSRITSPLQLKTRNKR